METPEGAEKMERSAYPHGYWRIQRFPQFWWGTEKRMAEERVQSEPFSADSLVTGNKTEKAWASIRYRGGKQPYSTGFTRVLKVWCGPRLRSEQGNWIGLSGNTCFLMPRWQRGPSDEAGLGEGECYSFPSAFWRLRLRVPDRQRVSENDGYHHHPRGSPPLGRTARFSAAAAHGNITEPRSIAENLRLVRAIDKDFRNPSGGPCQFVNLISACLQCPVCPLAHIDEYR